MAATAGLTLVLMLIALAGLAAAPEDEPEQTGVASLKQLSMEALGNVEVTTASKEPEPLWRTPSAVYVITQADIHRSGVTSLAEALRLAPGVDVGRIDSSHWAVGVRGFGDQFSKSVLVLIDGRNVYTPLFAGVFWAFQDTLLDDIDRIEVIRGPGGVIWGANALNGVINIITKSAGDTAGVLASVGGGNSDQAIGGFRYGAGNGRGFNYRLYGKVLGRGPQFHTDGADFDDARMSQTGFRADWDQGRDYFTLQGDFYKGKHGQSVSLSTFSPPSRTIYYDPLDVSGGNLALHWRRSLRRSSNVQLHAYYDRTYLLGPQLGESRHTFDVDFIHRAPLLRRHELTWGLGGRVSPSQVTQTVQAFDILPHDLTNHVYSAFAQDKITVVEEKLWLTLGSKLNHDNYTGLAAQPNLRLLWMPTAAQTVWTAVTRAVRTPSRLERDLQLSAFLGGNPPIFVRIAGNPDFKSESLIGYEAGYRTVVFGQFYVDVSGFHNEYDDLESFGAATTRVETSPLPAHLLLTIPYANGVTGASDGIEIAPDWNPAAWWRVRASYSYLRIDVENIPGNTDTSSVATYEGSSPRHQARVQSLVSLSSRWELDAAFRYVGALPARAVDAYGTFDLRLGWQPARQLRLSVIGQNLADRHHLEFGHDPGPPVEIRRSIFASITWSQ